MPRLAVGAKQDYLYQVTAHPEIQQLQSTFLARVEKVVEKAREKQEQYGGSACCIDFTNVTFQASMPTSGWTAGLSTFTTSSTTAAS